VHDDIVIGRGLQPGERQPAQRLADLPNTVRSYIFGYYDETGDSG